MAEWLAHPPAKQEVCGSNPASYLCWNTHVGKVTGCYAGYIYWQRWRTRVNLKECISHTPLQSSNKAEPTLALKPRGDLTSSPKQGYQWPQKWTCVQQNFFLKKKKLSPPESTGMCSRSQWLLNYSLLVYLWWIPLFDPYWHPWCR